MKWGMFQQDANDAVSRAVARVEEKFPSSNVGVTAQVAIVQRTISASYPEVNDTVVRENLYDHFNKVATALWRESHADLARTLDAMAGHTYRIDPDGTTHEVT